MKEKEVKSPAVPFFARYLEGQMEDLSEKEAEALVGGFSFPIATAKYPSDNEDEGGGWAATRKYPSDREDLGGDPILATMKYPSDNDD